MEQGLEASGLDGARARVEQAMRLIEQAGECLRSADAIALDIDPHYLAAAFTGKTVSLCGLRVKKCVRNRGFSRIDL